ncbi:MAG: hypothetical protein HY922_15590 [Elusimicrobia bacterium]|nr:hypothetical protein [Elusimicrobiota bacterium]
MSDNPKAREIFEDCRFLAGLEEAQDIVRAGNIFEPGGLWDAVKLGAANALDILQNLKKDKFLWPLYLVYEENILAAKRGFTVNSFFKEPLDKTSKNYKIVSFLRHVSRDERLAGSAIEAFQAYAGGGGSREEAEGFIKNFPPLLLAAWEGLRQNLPDPYGKGSNMIRMILGDVFLRAALMIAAARNERLPAPMFRRKGGEDETHKIALLLEPSAALLGKGRPDIGGEAKNDFSLRDPEQALAEIRGWVAAYAQNREGFLVDTVNRVLMCVGHYRDIFMVGAWLALFSDTLSKRFAAAQELLDRLDRIADPDERKKAIDRAFNLLSPEAFERLFSAE